MKKRSCLIAIIFGLSTALGGCSSPAQTPPAVTEQHSARTDEIQNIPNSTAAPNAPAEGTIIQENPAGNTAVTDTSGNSSTAQGGQPADTAVQNTQPADAAAAQNLSNAQPAPGTSTPINTETLQFQNSTNAPAAAGSSSQIGEAQALQIALDHAGVQASDIAFSYVKPDLENGRSVYDVEFYAGNMEYDYEIDASTGQILSFDYDMESHFTPGTDSTGSASISIDTAKQTALAKVPGATDSNIRIQTDYDDGRTVYEGKIIYNEIEYDFEIDAATGRIIEWEAESIYD